MPISNEVFVLCIAGEHVHANSEILCAYTDVTVAEKDCRYLNGQGRGLHFIRVLELHSVAEEDRL